MKKILILGLGSVVFVAAISDLWNVFYADFMQVIAAWVESR